MRGYTELIGPELLRAVQPLTEMLREFDGAEWLVTTHKAVIIMLRCGFIGLLFSGAWQDIVRRRIDVSLFIIWASAGILLRFLQIGLEAGMISEMVNHHQVYRLIFGHLADIGMAISVGAVLLFLSSLTEESIGRGDGWFFVVSGIYVGVIRNLALLAGGLGFSFVICMGLIVKGIIQGKDMKGIRLPFLPFLIPAGIGVMFI